MQEAANLIQAILSWPIIILVLIIVFVAKYRNQFSKWVDSVIQRIASIRVSGGGIQVELGQRLEDVNKSVERVTDDVRDFKADASDKFNQLMQSIIQLSVRASAIASPQTFINIRETSSLLDNVEADTRRRATDRGLDLERSREKARADLATDDEDAITALVHLGRDIEYLVGQLAEAVLPSEKKKLIKQRFSERTRLLRQANIISSATFDAIQFIRDLRNSVVHEPELVPTSDEKDEIMSLGEWVLTSLNTALQEQVEPIN